MSLSPILPDELIMFIFTHAHSSESTIRCVDRRSRAIMFSLIQSDAREILKNSEPKSSRLYQFINTLNDQELTTYESCTSLFRAIIQKVESLDKSCPNRMLSPMEVDALSTQIEDRSLENIWNKLYAAITYAPFNDTLIPPATKDAPAIRKWLNENQDAVQRVIVLNLAGCLGPKDTLPSEIGLFTSVQILNIDRNHLTSLPREIGKLVNLESLSAMHNQLTNLPPEIGQLEKLSRILLSDNPIVIEQLDILPLEVREHMLLDPR